MHLQSTKYTARTGIKIFKFGPNHWRHVDTNDAMTTTINDPYTRQVGPVFKSKCDLMSSHVPYLLTAGWLKLKINMPEPEFIAVTSGPYSGAYGWAMENEEIGIRVYGNSKVEAISNFKISVAEEYGLAVTFQ